MNLVFLTFRNSHFRPAYFSFYQGQLSPAHSISTLLDVARQMFFQKILTNFRRIFNWRVVVWLSGLAIAYYVVISSLDAIGSAPYTMMQIAKIFLPVGAIGLLIGFFLLIAERLNITGSAERENNLSDENIIKRFSRIEKNLASLSHDVLAINSSGDDKDAEFIQAMRPELERLSQIYFEADGYDRIKQEVIQNYGEKIYSSDTVKQLRHLFEMTITGLNSQLETQRNNSNTNLYIGLLFASFGIIGLGYVFYITYISPAGSANNENITAFVLSIIPRITFAVLVETVAFFFLSLYREDRNMIRFFRNEVTNYEAKFLALEVAVRFGDEKIVGSCIQAFTNTERNYSIKKGEKLVIEALRESDDRLFDKLIDKLSNNFDLSKLRK